MECGSLLPLFFAEARFGVFSALLSCGPRQRGAEGRLTAQVRLAVSLFARLAKL